MPKKTKGGSIEIEVTSKGSLKKLGREARNAGKDVGSVAKNVAESDRRLKSLSNQTSNSSKAFSKQAQTISGGLVPIYATLAAQVFAVSAAFRFLQEASDFKNLVAGQQAYGAFTGVMYTKLANDIRAATNAQISYTEASQAAAIGISSGLNASQITALGEAAANTSLILGRDVTDSFNRLIRGVTKAEPELLDELGIILRLDPALRNYAASIGKTKEQLNAFERSQAVAAEVIGQAEEKFGGIQKIMDPSAFAFNQFAQAFNDLLDTFKTGLGGLAQTVLPFFTKNVGALVGALGLFAIPIFKQITPNFKALEEQSKATISGLTDNIKTLKRESRNLDIAQEVAGTGKGQVRTLKDSAMKGLRGFGIEGKIDQRRIASFRNSAEKKIGIARNMNKKELQEFKMHLRNLEVAQKTSLSKQERQVQQSEVKKQQKMKETELKHAENQRRMTRATQMGAKAMNVAFKAMGYIGIGLMVFDFARMAIRALVGVDEAAEKLAERFNEIADATDTANDSLQKMLDLRKKDLIGLTMQAGQAAKAIQSIGMGQAIQDINFLLSQDLTKARAKIYTGFGFKGDYKIDEKSDLGAAIQGQIDQFKRLADLTADQEAADTFREYAQAIHDVAVGNRIAGDEFKDLAKRTTELSGDIVQLNQSAEAYSRTTKKVTEVVAGFLGKFAPATSSTKAIVAFKDNIAAITSNIEELTTVIDDAERKRLQKTEGMVFGGKDFFDTSQLIPSEDEQASIDKRTAFEQELKENQFLLGILQRHSSAEADILVKIEKQKALKAGIVQDGSILAAQANQAIAKEQKRLQIEKLRNDIKHQTEIINAKGGEVDEARRENAQNAKDVAEAKLTVLQAELGMMDRLLFMDKARADLELKRKTGGFASGFGLFGNITSDQIASTMTNMGMTEEEAISHLQHFNMEMKIANMELDTMEKMGTSVGNALTDGLANAFVDVAKGTTTFADAFRNMTIQILADIAAMTMKMAIFKMIAGFFAPGVGAQATIGTLTGAGFDPSNIATTGSGPDPFTAGFDFTGVRSGGIMSSPGYRSYARGGIAMGPDSGYAATLHGTEAVVPLGNSRSIPVELKGEGGGVNNITVNVNGGTEGNGQSPEQAKALGNMIQVATMEIIQREKRPGGVLSK